MAHKYKLRDDAPYLFIFVQGIEGEGDIDLTECFDPRSEEQKELAEIGDIVIYTRKDAQLLCDNEEGWFTCLEHYVDEVQIESPKVVQ